MSCNGCRVLRKGCSENCTLRPCLQWIESPEAQGHATVFVAKFFGRAGLMEFISGVPESERTALFQSLLYEACGRTVNPVFGAVGLLWSGNWHVCQEAVETVLRGGTLARPPSTHVPIGSNPGLPSVGNTGLPSAHLARPSSGSNINNIGSALSLRVADVAAAIAATSASYGSAKPAAAPFKRKYCTDELPHADVDQPAKRRTYSVGGPCHVAANAAASSASWDFARVATSSSHVQQQQGGPCGAASLAATAHFSSAEPVNFSSVAAAIHSSSAATAAHSSSAPAAVRASSALARAVDTASAHLMMTMAADRRPSFIGLPHGINGSIHHAASDQRTTTRNIQLDLTLGCPPHHHLSSASHLKSGGGGPARGPASPARVSSPNSTLSLNSEGSVTTLDSPTSNSRSHKLLDLLS